MTHTVVISPEARTDLADLFDYLAEKRGDDFAKSYIRKLTDHCGGFELFPARGQLRNDINPGLRLVGYKYQATIAFRIDGDTVTIMRILYAGKSLGETTPDEAHD